MRKRDIKNAVRARYPQHSFSATTIEAYIRRAKIKILEWVSAPARLVAGMHQAEKTAREK
jgi:hypothetical protein